MPESNFKAADERRAAAREQAEREYDEAVERLTFVALNDSAEDTDWEVELKRAAREVDRIKQRIRSSARERELQDRQRLERIETAWLVGEQAFRDVDLALMVAESGSQHAGPNIAATLAAEVRRVRAELDHPTVLNAALNKLIAQRDALIAQRDAARERDLAVIALVGIANQLTVPKCTEGQRFNGRPCARHSRQGIAIAAIHEQAIRVTELTLRLNPGQRGL